MRAFARGVALALVWGGAGDARALDPFEIQVYDGTLDRPGEAGVELHLNYWATGQTSSQPPELPLHGQFHATLEPSLGVLPFWELGAYLQSAVHEDGTVDWAGAKLRSKFVIPQREPNSHWRFGVNVEVSYLPPAYDRDEWGSELRPIVAWQNDDWLFAFNPILDQSLAGAGASDGPSFEPAIKFARTIRSVALGVEYYASIGPVSAPLPLRDQSHYLYEVFDLLSVPSFELNAGIGEGLTPASAGIVLKVIVGYAFEVGGAPRSVAEAHQTSRHASGAR
jgi:hypothetical protein